MFTEFKFNSEAIKELAVEQSANLKANKGFSDLKGYALSVISGRLAADPARYLDYGPYWWALKDALRDAGADFGGRDDAMVREAYSGLTDTHTIVMADLFREMYLVTWAVGTKQFILNADSGETYTLEDEDMDSLII